VRRRGFRCIGWLGLAAGLRGGRRIRWEVGSSRPTMCRFAAVAEHRHWLGDAVRGSSWLGRVCAWSGGLTAGAVVCSACGAATLRPARGFAPRTGLTVSPGGDSAPRAGVCTPNGGSEPRSGRFRPRSGCKPPHGVQTCPGHRTSRPRPGCKPHRGCAPCALGTRVGARQPARTTRNSGPRTLPNAVSVVVRPCCAIPAAGARSAGLRVDQDGRSRRMALMSRPEGAGSGMAVPAELVGRGRRGAGSAGVWAAVQATGPQVRRGSRISTAPVLPGSRRADEGSKLLQSRWPAGRQSIRPAAPHAAAASRRQLPDPQTAPPADAHAGGELRPPAAHRPDAHEDSPHAGGPRPSGRRRTGSARGESRFPPAPVMRMQARDSRRTCAPGWDRDCRNWAEQTRSGRVSDRVGVLRSLRRCRGLVARLRR
jgi:hypothetical protein